MADQESPNKRRGCSRLLAFAAALALGLGAMAAALLYTGQPQRLGVQYLLSSQLNARANLASISLKNPLIVNGLTLADKSASLYGPLLSVDQTSVHYDWRPRNGRHLHNVAVSGIRLSLQENSETNNFQFLLDKLSEPGGSSSADMTAWIPESVRLSDLWVELNFPSYYLRVDDLGVEATLENISNGAVRLSAPNTGISWSSLYAPSGRQFGAGTVDLNAKWNPDGADVDAEINLGPLAHVRGSVSLLYRNGEPFVAISVPEARLADPLWSAMLTGWTPIPIRFDQLALADSDVHVHQDGDHFVVDQATLDARIPALTVGPEDTPYYSGPLALAVRGNYGAETSIAGKVTLLEGTEVSGNFRLTPEGVAGDFETGNWSRAAVQALAPESCGPVLALLKPLNAVGIKGSISQQPDRVDVKANLRGRFGETSVEIPTTVVRQLNGEEATTDLEADVALNGGGVRAELRLPPDAPPEVTLALTNVELNPWTETLLGTELVPSLKGKTSGQVGIAYVPDTPISIALDLTGEGVGYGDLTLPSDTPVQLEGKLAYDLTTGQISSVGLHLLQDDVMEIKADKWNFDPGKVRMKTSLDSTLFFSALGALFGLDELYGSASVQGRLDANAEQLTLDEFRLNSEDLGYGDWSVPYGSTLEATGNLAYLITRNALQLTSLKTLLGEGTRFSAGSVNLQVPGESTALSVNLAPFSFETDFGVFVGRGLLAEGTEGTAIVKSDDFSWTGDTYTGVVAWDIAAERLVFPEKMATLERVSWSGRYNPGDDQDGGGPLRADGVSVYDIPFGAVDTRLRITPQHLTCDSLETTFLGGNLRMSGRVDYHDPTFPAQIDLAVSELDLEEFTRVFEPPDMVLTGKVNGTVDAILSVDGLQDLHVDLTASENLTLNRDMVQEILMSQYVNEAVGSKSVQKVIEKVIGKDEQRPFDKATLQLRLEDGLIRGTARMESKSLDVTVDINAEPQAILEAIRSTAEDR